MAVAALQLLVDRDDEPDGWVRAYPMFFRRRPNGDETKEYIAP